MGALLAREGLEFKRGEHGSTFAGGPLACAAARATIEVIEKRISDVPGKGKRFSSLLSGHQPRARGLMIGLHVGNDRPAVQKRCAENGVPVNCAADGNLRIALSCHYNDEIGSGRSGDQCGHGQYRAVIVGIHPFNSFSQSGRHRSLSSFRSYLLYDWCIRNGRQDNRGKAGCSSGKGLFRAGGYVPLPKKRET